MKLITEYTKSDLEVDYEARIKGGPKKYLIEGTF